MLSCYNRGGGGGEILCYVWNIAVVLMKVNKSKMLLNIKVLDLLSSYCVPANFITQYKIMICSCTFSGDEAKDHGKEHKQLLLKTEILPNWLRMSKTFLMESSKQKLSAFKILWQCNSFSSHNIPITTKKIQKLDYWIIISPRIPSDESQNCLKFSNPKLLTEQAVLKSSCPGFFIVKTYCNYCLILPLSE